MNLKPKQHKSFSFITIVLGLVLSSAAAFVFWYMLLNYLRLDFSSLINSAHSLSLIYLAVGATIIFTILVIALLHRVSNSKSSRYLQFLSFIFQIALITYIANFGLLYSFNIFSHAATNCYTVATIRASQYCLLLLKPPTASAYRVLNPNNQKSSLTKVGNHQGNSCQVAGNAPNSVKLYNASTDFYGVDSSSLQSIHRAVINFTAGISINSGKIAVDAPLCDAVTVSQVDSNNMITLTDTGTVATPTPTPTHTPTPVSTNTPTPTPIHTPSPTPTGSPTPTATTLKTGDLNGDGKVDIVDIGIVIDNYGKSPIPNTKADINHDGIVNIVDIGLVIDNYGK